MRISPRTALPKARRPASGRHKEDSAFTLIELLVVVGIIVVLASLLLPTLAQAMETSKRASTLSNMRQLTVLMLNYMNNNNGISPEQGNSSESWSSLSSSSNSWYNALPRMGGMKGAADYATGLAGERLFYSRDNMLYCPGAVYPSTNYENPLFAITMNSKLISGSATTIPLMAIPEPSRTVAFLENGLPNEQPFYSGEKYNGNQPYTYASRFVARYHNHTLGIVSFFDGHAEILNGGEVVCTNGNLGTAGKAYFPPQNSPGPQIIWSPSGTNPNN